MASVFSRILNREMPGYFVAENEEFFAILDAFPLAQGHTLVIPKQEVDYVFDLESEVLGRYFQFTKQVAKAIDAAIKCERVGVAVVGLDVPHAHIHLVPINHVGDIDFSKPKLELSEDQFKEIRDRIVAKFNELYPGSGG